MNSIILQFIAENLDELNRKYYHENKQLIQQSGKIRIGDFAQCSSCGHEEVIHYLYGGKHPLCRVCSKRELN